jgi:excisionase family DNA binding protein
MPTTFSAEPIALSIEQAAEALGLSRSAVKTLLVRETDPIPFFRYGTRVVIPRRELLDWTTAQTQGPNS